MGAIDPPLQWTRAEHLIHGVLCALCGEELPFPWDKERSGIEGIETESVPVDEFRDWYENTDWKEVGEWQREIQ